MNAPVKSFQTGAINLFDELPDFPAAECREADPADFFPLPGGQVPAAIERAKGICGGCREREDCLQWALEHKERGVWGGTTENERDDIREGRSPMLQCRRCETYFPRPHGRPGPVPKTCDQCRGKR